MLVRVGPRDQVAVRVVPVGGDGPVGRRHGGQVVGLVVAPAHGVPVRIGAARHVPHRVVGEPGRVSQRVRLPGQVIGGVVHERPGEPGGVPARRVPPWIHAPGHPPRAVVAHRRPVPESVGDRRHVPPAIVGEAGRVVLGISHRREQPGDRIASEAGDDGPRPRHGGQVTLVVVPVRRHAPEGIGDRGEVVLRVVGVGRRADIAPVLGQDVPRCVVRVGRVRDADAIGIPLASRLEEVERRVVVAERPVAEGVDRLDERSAVLLVLPQVPPASVTVVVWAAGSHAYVVVNPRASTCWVTRPSAPYVFRTIVSPRWFTMLASRPPESYV